MASLSKTEPTCPNCSAPEGYGGFMPGDPMDFGGKTDPDGCMACGWVEGREMIDNNEKET